MSNEIHDLTLSALSRRIKALEDWKEANREAFQKAVDDLTSVKAEFEQALAKFKEQNGV